MEFEDVCLIAISPLAEEEYIEYLKTFDLLPVYLWEHAPQVNGMTNFLFKKGNEKLFDEIVADGELLNGVG